MVSEQILKFFADYIEKELGIRYLPENYFQLDRRLTEIAKALWLKSPEDLYEKAKTGIFGNMKMLVLDAATNNETSFFRDPKAFLAVEKTVLADPVISSSTRMPIKIWSAACSTGQEVYSLAMVLKKWEQEGVGRDYSLLATDFSDRVLNQAKAGEYSQLEVQRGLPAPMLVKYFEKRDKDANGQLRSTPLWGIKQELKSKIDFKQLNLLQPWGNIGPFDLILCRNVLIYQKVENKQEVIKRMYSYLRPGGYLILGAAETLVGISEQFNLVRSEGTVIYQKGIIQTSKTGT